MSGNLAALNIYFFYIICIGPTIYGKEILVELLLSTECFTRFTTQKCDFIQVLYFELLNVFINRNKSDYD